MAENVCAGHSGITVRVDTLEKRVDGHDIRLDAGETRMDDIEQVATGLNGRLDALCDRLDRLIISIRWAIATMLAAVPLIVWILERGRP